MLAVAGDCFSIDKHDGPSDLATDHFTMEEIAFGDGSLPGGTVRCEAATPLGWELPPTGTRSRRAWNAIRCAGNSNEVGCLAQQIDPSRQTFPYIQYVIHTASVSLTDGAFRVWSATHNKHM